MLDFDILNMDLNGDGIADSYTEEQDLNGDGVTDAVYVDVDDDGNADFVVFDSDGDGTMDSVLAGFDTDRDGVPDTFVLLEDTDGNQIIDSMEVFHENEQTGELDLLSYEDFDDEEEWSREADKQEDKEPEELDFREVDGDRIVSETDGGTDRHEYIELEKEGEPQEGYGGRIVGYTDTGVSDLEKDLANSQEFWI